MTTFKFIPTAKYDPIQAFSCGFILDIDLSLEEVKKLLQEKGMLNPYWEDREDNVIPYYGDYEGTTEDDKEKLLSLLGENNE